MQIGNSVSLMAARSRALRQAKSRAMSRTGNRTNTSGRLSGNYRSGSLSSALNKLQSSGSSGISDTVSALQARSNYRIIRESADDLQESAEKLLATGDDSLFGLAIPDKKDTTEETDKTQGDSNQEASDLETEKKLAAYKSNVVKEITLFLDSYNTMVERMNKLEDTSQTWYLRELKSYASENRSALAALGIVQNSDGTLTVKKQVLQNADVEKMQKVFGSSNSFAAKTAKMAKSIETNAEAGLKSSSKTSSNYNRYGNSYNNLYNSGSWYNAQS